VRVTHQFHPWFGREFELLGIRQTWSEDRVFFVDGDDLPGAAGWPERSRHGASTG
jgi:hypothetical protein